MIYTLTYYPERWTSVDYTVESNYKDILSYEFEKQFHRNYNPVSYLTPEEKQFVKEFDSKWFKNEISEFDYYTTRNYPFLDWLKETYEEAALAEYEEDKAINIVITSLLIIVR